MIGVALEGGAERSSFTAGVMDALMAHDFYAGAASGTSAGAGCVLNYRSGQQGVALEMMIMERHSRYFGIRHMAHTGRFLNLDHMAHEYASRISWDAYRHPSMQTDFVATCCEDGKPAYLTDAGSKQRLFTAIKASCALPIICEPVELDGRHYVDGSIVDPIPFLHLLEQGCEQGAGRSHRQRECPSHRLHPAASPAPAAVLQEISHAVSCDPHTHRLL